MARSPPVMRAIAAGSTLTEAAHLSNTFRRMFGLTASDLLALGAAIDIFDDVLPGAAPTAGCPVSATPVPRSPSSR